MDFNTIRTILDACLSPEPTTMPVDKTTQDSTIPEETRTIDARSIKSIKLHLETITTALVTGLNHRLFDLQNVDIYSFIDPDFSAAPNPPFSGPPVDFEGYLAYVQTVAATFPDYSVKVLDLSTAINDKTKTAEVYMNFEVIGTAPGVVRQSVGVFYFRQSDRKWRLLSYKGFDGIEGTESGVCADGKAK